ncbi:bile acid:sodium symporter family protein [Thalassomonas actiniarum]|uniref:Bile acid:sodium symporter n=1 Tax=Thalassomonas actiniarum TaxID=485447 RepID=A0AAF0C4M1_9GAMM|nr:hypothetical protein [Thalassomonas actiniarum]WDE02442.1 hypothetical protein SG35_028960 [Thalassomonas actiniarum]
MNNGVLLTVIVPLAMFLMMLGLGTTLTTQALTTALRNKKVLGLGLLAQLAVVPVCAALVVFTVDMQAEFKLGIMLLACCPGGTSSNLFCHLGKGNLALSVALTTFSSLAVLLTMPLILEISAQAIFSTAMPLDIPQLEILKRLFFMTLLPVMTGIAISHYFPALGERIAEKSGPFGLAFLIFLAGLIVMKEWQNLIAYLPVLGATILGMTLFILACVMFMLKIVSPSMRDRFTIYIEACIQSSALAMFIALTVMENGSMVAIPAGMYSLTMYLIGFSLVFFYRRSQSTLTEKGMSPSMQQEISEQLATNSDR